MNSKLCGGILLIIGTTIGAGMLALPVAIAQLGFWISLPVLIGCWALMTFCSFIFLEINLWLPSKANLISMAGKTLGKKAQAIVWVIYLLLQYSVLSAYIVGGGDLFRYFSKFYGINISLQLSSVLFTILFGIIVYFGIRLVDYFNRVLMFGKLGALIILIILLIPFVSSVNLANNEIHHVKFSSSVALVMISFANMLVIPTLRSYFDDDIKSLRKAILIGTLIPLILYIVWDMIVLGILPLQGNHGINQLIKSATVNSDLILAINATLKKDIVTNLAKIFTSICMIASFLNVSICLTDFLYDGLSLSKRWKNAILIFIAAFLPPLLIIMFYPNAFIRCLEYAGVCCFILMVLLPALMVWSGRYHLLMTGNQQVPGGKIPLGLLMLFATFMIGYGIINI